MARALWKGTLRFSDARVPVKLFSAVGDHTVRFRLLHGSDETPIEEHMINASTGEPVAYEDLRRGYELDDGVMVAFQKNELATLEPPPSRDIAISTFVDPTLISDAWYARPYFLAPDGNGDDYIALAQALANEEKEGLAHWTMRKKSYVGALRSEGDHLLLITLRHKEEVVQVAQKKNTRDRELSAKELTLAKQLVSTLEADFDPTVFHDEYNDRVLELIDAKSKGKVLKMPARPKKQAQPKSLEAALAASLGARRGPKKAAGRKRRAKAG